MTYQKKIVNQIKMEILRTSISPVIIPACFIGLPASYLAFGLTGIVVTSLVLCLLTFSGVWITATDASFGVHR